FFRAQTAGRKSDWRTGHSDGLVSNSYQQTDHSPLKRSLHRQRHNKRFSDRVGAKSFARLCRTRCAHILAVVPAPTTQIVRGAAVARGALTLDQAELARFATRATFQRQ